MGSALAGKYISMEIVRHGLGTDAEKRSLFITVRTSLPARLHFTKIASVRTKVERKLLADFLVFEY